MTPTTEFEPGVTDREPRMHVPAQHSEVLLEAAGQRDKIDVLRRDQDFLSILVGELEGPKDDPGFAFREDTLLLRVHEDKLQLLLREGRPGDLPMTETAQDPGREPLEEPMEGPQHDVEYLERARETEQEMLGPPNAKMFWHELSHDDVQRGDEQERKNGGRDVDQCGRDGACREQQDEQTGERVLAEPTDAEAGRSDADLRHREIFGHAIDDEDRIFGGVPSLTDQFFQSRPTHAHDGELGGDEDTVDHDKREGSGDGQQHYEDDIGH